MFQIRLPRMVTRNWTVLLLNQTVLSVTDKSNISLKTKICIFSYVEVCTYMFKAATNLLSSPYVLFWHVNRVIETLMKYVN